jgi:hypothetical protein
MLYYRDMQRRGEVGGVSFALDAASVPDPNSVPGLAAALAEFTRRGKEVTDWTPLNISERISVVRMADERASLCLSGASVSIYRHSSELLHGTYFSVVHFWSGSGSPSLTKQRFS